MADSRLNLADLPPAEWSVWHDGFACGYRVGLDAGRKHERDEAAELGRRAAAIVHRMADLDERDRAADEAQAERRASWWRRRRGEVV